MTTDTFPVPEAGPDLADLRKSVGIQQADLARRLGMHRVSLRGWERSASVDPIRAARYRRALHELVAEQTAGPAEATA